MDESADLAALRDGKHLLLGAVNDILDVPLRGKRHVPDLVRGSDQRAQKAFVLDDLRIIKDIRGGRYGLRDDFDVFFAFFLVVDAAGNERVNERDKVDLPVFGEEIVHGVEDLTVLCKIKILPADDVCKVGKAVRID